MVKSKQIPKPHPLGIKPYGNRILDVQDEEFYDTRQMGLGRLNVLDDQLIYSILCDVDAVSLARISSASKAFYCWTHYDEFWKYHTLSDFNQNGQDFQWEGSTWRETYAHNYRQRQSLDQNRIDCKPSYIKLKYFYSDFMYQSHVNATTDIDQDWLKTDNIQRVSNLSAKDFKEKYEDKAIPVIITDIVPQWKCYGKWSKKFFIERYGKIKFRAEAMCTSMENYFAYSENSLDESPLYLFDKDFCETCPELAEDFSVPKYFQEDLFKLLGSKRPDYRWIVMGPSKSGSSFHKDPNATSAWNATIFGSKKWILIPPNITPPGTFPSKDGSEVVTPASLLDWFTNYYTQLEDLPVKPIECITRAGDLIFVPSTWWHCVINLEETCAITQNYVSTSNLQSVLKLLKHKKNQISGIPCDYVDQIGVDFENALIEYEEKSQDVQQKRKLSDIKQLSNKKPKQEVKWWNQAQNKENDEFVLF